MREILKAYKRRQKATQRRLTQLQQENKRIQNLLALCNEVLPAGQLRNLITDELHNLRHKQ